MGTRKIDVHAHFLPPSYCEALLAHHYANVDGMPSIPTWSPEAHLNYMDLNGTSKSILSISSPGTNLDSSPTVNALICSEVNDYANALKLQYPSRFGYFASLPLPDVPAALAELTRITTSTLNPDGFVLLSNFQGVYIGDPILRPVLTALNSQNALIFIHPTAPCAATCCRQHAHQSPADRYASSAPLATTYPAPLAEYFFDSGRTTLDLLISGTVSRFPRIRWIVSHCGGVLPMLLDRVFLCVELGLETTWVERRDGLQLTKDEMQKVVQEQFWYDLAGSSVPNQVEALLKFVGKERLLFGSDVPWTPFEASAQMIKGLQEALPKVLGKDNLDDVYWGNAEKLLCSQESSNNGGNTIQLRSSASSPHDSP